MTPEEVVRFMEAFYVKCVFDAEYAWYLAAAFRGEAGQNSMYTRPNGER